MVQPASIDLKLGPSFRVFHNHRIQTIDLANPPTDLTEHVEVADGDIFVIHPGEFVLGRTVEVVELPDDLVARIEGKSSLGRLGLICHAHRGLRRPWFLGHPHARDHQLQQRSDRAAPGPPDRPAEPDDARHIG